MSLRKIASFTLGTLEARVYRDAEWNEYRVRFYKDGVLQPESGSHTDDRTDALQTAQAALASWQRQQVTL